MRINLRINFDKIEELATKSDDYAKSLEEVKSAVSKFHQVVEKNKGLAADELKDKPNEINKKIEKLIGGLESMSGLLKEFDGEMTGIIRPLNEGNDMYLPTFATKNKVKNLQQQLEAFSSIALNYKIPKLGVPDTAQGTHTNSMDTSNPIDMDKYNEVKNKLARMEQVYEKVKSVSKSLYSEYEQELENIYKKVDDFENTDDEYENKAESIYESYLDLEWWQTTTAKVIFGVVGTVAAIALIVVGAPVIAAGLAAVGLSATAAATVAGVTVVVAKGALIGALASGAIDTTMAVYKKEDIDSAFGDGLSKGLITGAITSGVGEAAPVLVSKGGALISRGTNYISRVAPNATNTIVQFATNTSQRLATSASSVSTSAYNFASRISPNMANKAAQLGSKAVAKGAEVLSNPTAIAEGAVEMGGDILGDGAAAYYLGNDFDLSDSVYKSATGKVIESGTDGMVKAVDEQIERINLSRGNEQIKKVSRFLNRSANAIVEDESKNAAIDFKNSLDNMFETGEGSISDNFDHSVIIEDKEKLAESALSGNKKDPKSILQNRVEKVIDYIENSFENRRNRNM